MIAHRLKNIFSFFISALFLNGCISDYKLYNKVPTDTPKFTLQRFNGNYSNKNIADSSGETLWQILYESKSFKRDTTQITDNTIINLSYDGKKTLLVTALKDSTVLNSFELKGKLSDNYISVKRHLFLIPIPFLFYLHHERKAIIGCDGDGSLIICNGTEEFAWILLAGGYESVRTYKFKKAGLTAAN